VLEVPAPETGLICEIKTQVGDVVTTGQVLAILDETAAVHETAPAAEAERDRDKKAAPVASPAAEKIAAENNVDLAIISGTGKDQRITKQDVIAFIGQQQLGKTADSSGKPAIPTPADISTPAEKSAAKYQRIERRAPMSRLRERVAQRLKQVQQEAAILTTFNEINMQSVMDARNHYRDEFEKRYGARLGFMSFFVKACAQALQNFPIVNASIDGSEIIYHDYIDIGIAVSSPRGLVVPILRDVEHAGFGDIELRILELAAQARDGKLSLEDLTGGTFSITNGGVFGSMLSTPILNPPQSAILGMHNITQRAVVENGEIVIRPMMYVALSYDHRLIDGRDAVQFLVSIKQDLEDPSRLLIGL